jgi:hypothetical protein
LKGMIDMVRNKLLQFALELQRETGGAEPSPDNPSPAVVEKQVIQIIYGGQTNVYGGSIGGNVIQGKNHTVIKGDFNSLSKSLAEIGIPENLHSGLNAALAEDGEHGHTTGIGPKTKGWLKLSLAALGKGTAKVVGGVLETSATAAILAYYGVKAVS